MDITTPPSPWMYLAMTVICVMAGVIYTHDFFYVETTMKMAIIAFVWIAMACVWMYSFHERRRDRKALEEVLAVKNIKM